MDIYHGSRDQSGSAYQWADSFVVPPIDVTAGVFKFRYKCGTDFEREQIRNLGIVAPGIRIYSTQTHHYPLYSVSQKNPP